MVGETKVSGRSQYRVSVNLGRPAGHAHFFQVSIIASEGGEDISVMNASSVDHFEEAFQKALIALVSYHISEVFIACQQGLAASHLFPPYGSKVKCNV